MHRALISLPEHDRVRLGVLADWETGPHLLTYRQTEYTFGLVAGALGKNQPDGLPSGPLQGICDDLLEASAPEVQGHQQVAGSRLDGPGVLLPAPARDTGDCADPEASWGHRKNNLLRSEDELFYGYYLSAGVMMPEENGPPSPSSPAAPRYRRAGTTRSRPSPPC